MKILLIGAPGSGKGTQANFLKSSFNLFHLSTGDLLREQVSIKSELGEQAKQFMDSGQLVPDELIMQMVLDRLGKPDCKQGYLLDGFPRNLNQAEFLNDNQVQLDLVFYLKVADSELVRRVVGRRVHPQSGRIYHIEFSPPQKEGVDDVTGEPLVHRQDDNEDTIKQRLATFHDQTREIIDYYKGLSQSTRLTFVELDGSLSPKEISQSVLKHCG